MSWLLSRGRSLRHDDSAVLLRLTYLGMTNVFALLRMLSVSDRDKGVETWRSGTRSRSCSGSWARTGRGSPPPTGHS